MRVHPPATDRLSPTSSAASALPPDENQQSVRTESDQLAQLAAYERSRKQSVSSSHSCESMDDNKTRRLWRCMLDLQERYGCYNSTRINMALDAGDEAIGLMRKSFLGSRGALSGMTGQARGPIPAHADKLQQTDSSLILSTTQ